MYLGENHSSHKAGSVSFKCYWHNAQNMTEINILYKYLKYEYILQKSIDMLMTNLDAL